MPSFCAYYDQSHCRSCQWIETSYADQLAQKSKSLREALSFFASFDLQDAVGSSPAAFRNRAKLSVTGTVDRPIIGLLGEGDLDQGRELLECPIHHPRLNAVLAELPAFIRDARLEPYRIQARKGELKGVILFHSPGSGESYLRFILRSKEGIPRIRAALSSLQAKLPDLVCVSANIQPIPHAILEGPEEIVLTERSHIVHQLGDLRLKLAPQAFVQTNVEVATELYRAAGQWIAEAEPSKMMELYCGQGAFSFFAAQAVPGLSILGIEINPDAVRAANLTAQEMALGKLSFKASDATKVGAEVAAFVPDLILVNPPRRGIGEGVNLILEHLPRHLVYSSCDVESLASDLRKLEGKYRLKRARVFDLFPHTSHFETLAWLERRDQA